MKNYPIKALLMVFTTTTAILLTPKITFAQVDYSLLTEVAKSCQEDALSPQYYKSADINFSGMTKNNPYIEYCIKARYFHSLVLSKLPWLASKGELVPGYLGSVAVSLMALHGDQDYKYTELVNCIISQNGSSQECRSSALQHLSWLYWNTKLSGHHLDAAYICPSCVVASNDISSEEKMADAFIQWFLTLDKPQRREMISLLLNVNIRVDMLMNSNEAVSKYIEIRQRVEQQEQEQRRIDLLGE